MSPMAKKPVVFFNARVVEVADTLGLRPNAFLCVRVRVPSRAYLRIYIIIINSTTKKETNMITSLILLIGIPTIGLLVTLITNENAFVNIGLAIAAICTILFIGGGLITKQVSQPTEITTPGKYTSQTYYIDNSKRLYIQQNDTTKPFGGDISSKIEYKDSAKEPSIEFKTIKSFGDLDLWIPSKYKEEFKTSISKVILPKSALTEKLTKVNVLNQSDSNDLTLIN